MKSPQRKTRLTKVSGKAIRRGVWRTVGRAGAQRRTARLWPLLSGGKPPSGFKQERDWKKPHPNKSLWLQRKDWATGKRNRQEAAEQACVYTHTHTRAPSQFYTLDHLPTCLPTAFSLTDFFLRRTSKKKSTTVYSFSRLNC